MARRCEADLPAREEVLDAAVTVLLERGYEAASLDAVAAAAGLSRRTLFNQFESKEALFADALHHFWNGLPSAAVEIDAAALADPLVGLTRLGTALAAFYAPPQVMALVKMIVADGSRFPTLSQSMLGKIPVVRAIYNYLVAMTEAKRLNVVDDDIATRQFIGMIMHPLVWMPLLGAKKRRAADYSRRVVDEAVATFLARYAI